MIAFRHEKKVGPKKARRAGNQADTLAGDIAQNLVGIAIAVGLLWLAITSIGKMIIKHYQPERASYRTQLERLETIQENLTNFQQYVADQKARLESEQEAFEGLKEENARLKLIIEADQEKAKEYLAAIDDERNRILRNRWWFGFGRDILVSLTTLLLVGLISKIRHRKTGDAKPHPTED